MNCLYTDENGRRCEALVEEGILFCSDHDPSDPNGGVSSKKDEKLALIVATGVGLVQLLEKAIDTFLMDRSKPHAKFVCKWIEAQVFWAKHRGGNRLRGVNQKAADSMASLEADKFSYDLEYLEQYMEILYVMNRFKRIYKEYVSVKRARVARKVRKPR